MTNRPLHRIKTISEFHAYKGLPKPEHPLVSLIPFEKVEAEKGEQFFVNDYYAIALKRNFNGKMKYGQQEYDFDEGVMLFTAPGQVYSIEATSPLEHSGWLLLIHPDFLWNTSLAKKIQHYEYFSYAVNEALHLSEKEEAMITDLLNISNGNTRAISTSLARM